jgi:hypothetical protein
MPARLHRQELRRALEPFASRAGCVWSIATAEVTGIGGAFFKGKSDHKRLAAWYARHLGLRLEEWGGAILKWPEDKAK